MRAELISIGTELLLGEIVDTNSSYLAGRLVALGIDCLHMATVGDNLERAVETIERALTRADLVVCTGGLGPTEDDLTREAISAALGETPALDPTLLRELEAWFGGRGVAMPERNRKQAWLIPSARPLANPLGTAPGWSVEQGGRRIIAMPGVPSEMTRMWEVEVEPTLIAGMTLRTRTLKLLGIGESAVEEALGELVRSTTPTVATYAKNDGVHVRLADKDPDPAAADARIAAMEARLRGLLGKHLWGVDGDTLGGVIGRALRAHGWSLATGESLSGGEVARVLVGSLATGTPGAWYAGGAILVGADDGALARAVAPFGASVTLLVPDGGMTDVTLIVRTPDRERRATLAFRSVEEGRRRSALAALDLLRRALC